jgi:hypothetical protein
VKVNTERNEEFALLHIQLAAQGLEGDNLREAITIKMGIRDRHSYRAMLSRLARHDDRLLPFKNEPNNKKTKKVTVEVQEVETTAV